MATATAELVLTDRAALALLDDAERALAEVTTPEDADELWRKVKAVEEAARLARLAETTVGAMTRVRLRAKRRWGQLLPDPDPGKRSDLEPVTSGNGSKPGDQRVAENRARKLGAIPAEAFEAALENTDPDRPPTEASLLRMSGRPMDVHFSSQSDEWATPQDLFDELDAEFKFELDVCALDFSAKCPTYFTPADDGLAQDWKGFRCWMNPPYGEVIGRWIAKAHCEAEAGATVACLVPARVDTGWWWDYCRQGEIRFLRGRLKFGGSPNSAPFPSAIVVFGPDISPTVKWWER